MQGRKNLKKQHEFLYQNYQYSGRSFDYAQAPELFVLQIFAEMLLQHFNGYGRVNDREFRYIIEHLGRGTRNLIRA